MLEEALELTVLQLPEPPLTLVDMLVFSVPEELLQLYAIVLLGVVVITNVEATKITPIIIKLFMLNTMVLDISIVHNDVLELTHSLTGIIFFQQP